MIQVGATDTLRFETTANGITNVSEFGTTNDPQCFRNLLAMSTYQNIEDGVACPAVIFVHGVNDPRVARESAHRDGTERLRTREHTRAG